jgi:hypothetical protein
LTAALGAALLLATPLAAATLDPSQLAAAPGGDPAINTRAIQVSLNVDGRPSDDWRQQGPVTLEGCRAHGNDVGLLIKTVADLTVSGGDYSGNDATPVSDGIQWIGQSNALRRADTRGLVIRGVRASGNRRHGIHLDGQGLRGRAPSGSITGCSLIGNGSGGLQVSRAPDDDLITEMLVDDACRGAAPAMRAP